MAIYYIYTTKGDFVQSCNSFDEAERVASKWERDHLQDCIVMDDIQVEQWWSDRIGILK